MKKIILISLGLFLSTNSAFTQSINNLTSNLVCPELKYFQKLGSNDKRNNGETSKLQSFLKQNLSLSNQQFLVSGHFGRVTQNFVKQFQENNNLIISGQVGQITRNKILGSCSSSVDDTITNYEMKTSFLEGTQSVMLNVSFLNSVQQSVMLNSYQVSQYKVKWGDGTEDILECNGLAFPNSTSEIQRQCGGGLSTKKYSQPGNFTISLTGQNGNILKSISYEYKSAISSCTFNGQSYTNNQSLVTYLTSSVPLGSTCQSQTRTCTNGTLSGSYTNASCSVTVAQSCSAGGVTIANLITRLFYLSSTVPYGSICQSENRTCNNGVLSGGSNFSFSSCQQTSDQQMIVNLTPFALTTPTNNQTVTSRVISFSGTCDSSKGYVFLIVGAESKNTLCNANNTFSDTLNYVGNFGQVNAGTGYLSEGGAFKQTMVLNLSFPYQPLTTNRNDKKTSINFNNVYSPDVILKDGWRYVYFGGWVENGQTHDNIYRMKCGNLGDGCTDLVKVLDGMAHGFDHINDPSIIRKTDGTYIMYLTGLVNGLNAFTPSNNKIYYSTSSDGVTWTAPILVISNAWLPSATIGVTGQVEVFGNETLVMGNVARFKLGANGTTATNNYEALVFSNGEFYSNSSIKYRSSIGIYQMFGERSGATAIDYLSSTDGIHFTLVTKDVVTSASAGMLHVRTPGQDSDTGNWLYYGATNNPNATENKILFQTWTAQ